MPDRAIYELSNRSRQTSKGTYRVLPVQKRLVLWRTQCTDRGRILAPHGHRGKRLERLAALCIPGDQVPQGTILEHVLFEQDRQPGCIGRSDSLKLFGGIERYAQVYTPCCTAANLHPPLSDSFTRDIRKMSRCASSSTSSYSTTTSEIMSNLRFIASGSSLPLVPGGRRYQYLVRSAATNGISPSIKLLMLVHRCLPSMAVRIVSPSSSRVAQAKMMGGT